MTDSVIRSYHEYRSIWEAAFGEVCYTKARDHPHGYKVTEQILTEINEIVQ